MRRIKLPEITLKGALVTFFLVYLGRYLLYSNVHDTRQKISFDQGVEDGMVRAERWGIESTVPFLRNNHFNSRCNLTINNLELPIQKKASALRDLFQDHRCYREDYYPELVKFFEYTELVDHCKEKTRIAHTRERLRSSNEAIVESEKEIKEICQRDPIFSMPPDPKITLDHKELSKLREPDSSGQILSFSIELLLVLSIVGIGWQLFKSIEKSSGPSIEIIGFDDKNTINKDLQDLVQKFNEKKMDKKLLPETFLCHISKEILTKPVLLASDITGRRYQLECLHIHLKRQTKYPNSETEIPMDRFILNRDRELEARMIKKLTKILSPHSAATSGILKFTPSQATNVSEQKDPLTLG